MVSGLWQPDPMLVCQGLKTLFSKQFNEWKTKASIPPLPYTSGHEFSPSYYLHIQTKQKIRGRLTEYNTLL